MLVNQIICSPNPFKEFTQISFEGKVDKRYYLKVFNSLGQIVFEKSLMAVDGSFETILNLRDQPPGLYLVVLQAGNELISGMKIIKD